jgi:hypothetical protein
VTADQSVSRTALAASTVIPVPAGENQDWPPRLARSASAGARIAADLKSNPYG